ncbi:IS3 ORF2 [Escherichia coli]|nr:IS3 ORF2 [Escherichia coli]
MKYVFIENHRAEFSIKAMCRVLRVARSGWYVWLRRRHQMSLRQQFRLTCDAAVHKAFFEQSSDTVLPALLTNCRSSILKPLPPACVVRSCGRKPAGSSARSATVHMACPYWRICWSRTSAPAARTRSGRVTSRTCVPMRAGCISQ